MTVNTTRYGFTGALCTDTEKEVSYPNRPGGVILEDANVKIDFCSDGTGMVRCHLKKFVQSLQNTFKQFVLTNFRVEEEIP